MCASALVFVCVRVCARACPEQRGALRAVSATPTPDKRFGATPTPDKGFGATPTPDKRALRTNSPVHNKARAGAASARLLCRIPLHPSPLL